MELTGFMEDEIARLYDEKPEDDVETVPRMEIQAFEHHHYLVFMFHDLREWACPGLVHRQGAITNPDQGADRCCSVEANWSVERGTNLDRIQTMDVMKAIKERASTRAFLSEPVSQETVRTILDAARWAPSGANSQPWQVAAVTGDVKQRIGDAIVAALNQGQKPNPDYHYYANRIPKPYRSRQVACGKALYGALGIERDDEQRRKEQWLKNYHGFGAPLELFVFLEEFLEKGSWIDMGMFIQNLMLAAGGCGLETCPQAAMAEFPDIVRETLGLPKTLKLVCGIAVGYPDRTAPVNHYRTEREPVDAFTKWFGWET